MDTEPLLSFDPSELIFLFELNKQLSSSIKLLNKTQNHVAFKLLTTNPKNYVVRPRIGILLPGSVLHVTVTMRAVREPPLNMRCKDKFMIRSAVASPGATTEDVRTMFNKEAGHVFQEFKLRVVYSMLTQSSCEASVTEDRNTDVSEVINPVLGPQDNDLQMSTGKLLDIQPPKLELPLIPKKETSCSIQLSNVSENRVAFTVKTDSPKYSVRPNIGILLPKSTCDITVRMKAQNEVSSDIQSEDKFLIQSVVAPAAATAEDITLDMFDNATSPIEECELQVISISKPEDNSDRIIEFILRGVVTSLLGLASWYLMKQTLTWIWSLTMLAMMLVIKMVKKLVSDSVEDWIVKTLLYIVMHFVFRRKDIPLSS